MSTLEPTRVLPAVCKTTIDDTMLGKDGYLTIAGQALGMQGGFSDLELYRKEYDKLLNHPDRIEDYLATQSNRKDA